MDKLELAKERLNNAHNKHENDYQATITKLNDKENELLQRIQDLNNEKHKVGILHGNINEVSKDDIVEINIGSSPGTVITAKRSVLISVKGSKMEVLFSGRYDKVIKRDAVHGRILLPDVNPAVFQFIIAYLEKLMEAEEANQTLFPDLPKLTDEYFHLLPQHLDLFGIVLPMLPDSSIVKSTTEMNCLHNWLEEVDQGTPSIMWPERHVRKSSDGEFKLIYRSSRDGLTNSAFHRKTGNHTKRTITIIETTCGIVLGGYSDLPWVWHGGYAESIKTFLFVLRKSDIAAPIKLNQTRDSLAMDGDCAIYNDISQGSSFGAGHDLEVNDSIVTLCIGCTYEAGPFKPYSPKDNTYAIKEMEVYHVTDKPAKGAIAQQTLDKEALGAIPKCKIVSGFSDGINKAIKERQESLRLAEVEVSQLEIAFKNEKSC